MNNLLFNEICDAVTNIVNKLGSNYSIVLQKGLGDEKSVKRVVVQVNGKHYLHIDSDNFLFAHDLFPNVQSQTPIYSCYPESDGKFVVLISACSVKAKAIRYRH